MATYYVPQVRVFQEYATAAASVAQPLNAFVFGPNYNLFRYVEEKASTAIGAYDRAAGITALWPNRPAGSEVDQAWTRVFMDNTWMEYFRDYIGTGQEIKPVVGYPNRITCPTLTFASYKTWDRSAAFLERDVQVGDGVVLRAHACGEDITIHTRVAGLVNDVIAPVVGDATSDTKNAPDTTQGANMSQTTGTTGTVDFTADGTNYDGLATGDTIESYYLTVTLGGAFGTAQLSVASASGRDNVLDPIIPTDGGVSDVGTRGLTVMFSTLGSSTPFEVGQVFRVDVNQLWAMPTPVSDTTSDYTGAKSGTYVITVTEGALWADGPRVFVSSTGTLDSSGPYTVASDTYITLPTGVRIKFNGAGVLGLCKNDKYYVTVEAATLGAIHTLELTNTLPDAFYSLCGGGSDPAPTPIDLDVSLSIVKNVEITRTRAGMIANWTTSATQVVVNPLLTVKDATWYDTDGTLYDLNVIAGDTYVQYRSLRNDFTAQVGSLTSAADVETILGPAVDANPLALGVLKAAENSNGKDVMFMATVGDTLAAYSEVLEAVYDREDVYGFCPLTHDKNILDVVKAHVLEESTGERGKWRVMWVGAQTTEESAVLTTDSAGDMLLATILDDTDTSGTQYTRVRCNTAEFITGGVKAGMQVRANYLTNPVTGIEEYETYTVDAVLTEEELRLASGPETAVTVPSRMEVWQVNSKEDIANQVIALAGSLTSHRVRVVFPDLISNAGVAMDSMYLCCALAGLRSGVWPHQPLTNVELTGFDDVSRTTKWLGGRLLNTMAAAGVWIVTQDNTGVVYTRHQLTTDTSIIDKKEDSCVATFDAVSYRTLTFFRNARYIGRRNITPQLLSQLGVDFDGLINTIVFETTALTIGPMILGAKVVSLSKHPTLLDTILATVNVILPKPFNNFDITLVSVTTL